MPGMQTFRIRESAQLLDYLFRALAPQKKTGIKQLLKHGSVRVNGRVVTLHRTPLESGDTLEILDPKTASFERLKTQLEFRIVAEDPDLVVVEKPAGLLTMGTETEKKNTLYFKLMEYERTKSRNARARIFIVHRLDRDASGLLVFAKSESAKRRLQDHWDKAVKKYYAVTEGAPQKNEGRVETDLVEDDFKRVYVPARSSPQSRRAATRYRVLRAGTRYALLEITLETGRKNQIRVHLASLGCPIAGDLKYGAKSDPLRRLGLHACFLSFAHPVTGQIKTYESPLPQTFQKLLTTKQ